MAVMTAPRSVSDATRFTATTPYASSKSSAPAQSSSRFARPAARGSRGGGAAPKPPGGPGGGNGNKAAAAAAAPEGETLEQKVARLRATHQRAREAKVSRFDMIVDKGRRVFDSTHKITVMGLVGLTAIAGLLTVYTAVDMITYNRKRKAEFVEAQKRIEADSLEAARLAYMTGKATPEQAELVEYVRDLEEKRAAQTASGSIFTKIPDLLSAPKAIVDRDNAPAPHGAGNNNQTVSEAAKWPAAAATEEVQEPTREDGSSRSSGGGWRSWFSSAKGTAEQGAEHVASQAQNDSAQARIREAARAAFEKEKENQQNGGPLDRMGLDSGTKAAGEEVSSQPPPKRGWGWW